MSEPYLGQITCFPYTFPPMNWADCNGQLLPISQYAALFSLLGTTYGGDGRTTFGLPDLQGRVPVGQGPMPGGDSYQMGMMAGGQTVTLTTATVPPHRHTISANPATGTSTTAAGNLLAMPLKTKGKLPSDKGNIYNAASPTVALAANSITQAGNSQPHNNVQPSLGLRYCIALNGIFPSRS